MDTVSIEKILLFKEYIEDVFEDDNQVLKNHFDVLRKKCYQATSFSDDNLISFDEFIDICASEIPKSYIFLHLFCSVSKNVYARSGWIDELSNFVYELLRSEETTASSLQNNEAAMKILERYFKETILTAKLEYCLKLYNLPVDPLKHTINYKMHTEQVFSALTQLAMKDVLEQLQT